MNVVLVGNYPPDRQQSMVRFASCLETGLKHRAVPARIVVPPARLTAGRNVQGGVGKWLAYVDKFVLFPRALRRLANASPKDTVFHVCDHSNAMYLASLPRNRQLATCHDLLAVRGALGEADAYCPASRMGQVLQQWILRSLAGSPNVVCVSRATANDFQRLAPDHEGRLKVIPLGQNAPYRALPPEVAWPRLEGFSLRPHVPFVLNVGSSLPRKNRDGCLRIFQKIAGRFSGPMVFVGEPLAPDLLRQAEELAIRDRIVQLEGVANDQLEALYSVAHAMLFPTRAEGFGWPVLEAQICGCPVVCSDRTSVPEVAGEGALVHALADEDGFAESLLKLLDPGVREDVVAKGHANAAKFTTDRMIDAHVALYREILAAA